MFIKEQIKFALLSVKRPGMGELVKKIEEMGYFEQPSSAKYHGACKYGLMLHSWNVHNLFNEKNKMLGCPFSDELVIIAPLLHDLNKVGAYKEISEGKYDYNKEHFDKFGNKHGVLSVERIEHFMRLTDEEKLCIKFHMGIFSCFPFKGTPEYTPEELLSAMKWKSLQIMIASDQEASMLEASQQAKQMASDIVSKRTEETKEEKPLLTMNAVKEYIEKHDNNNGIDIMQLVKHFGEEEKIDKVIDNLKRTGDVFEIKPGFVKVL